MLCKEDKAARDAVYDQILGTTGRSISNDDVTTPLFFKMAQNLDLGCGFAIFIGSEHAGAERVVCTLAAALQQGRHRCFPPITIAGGALASGCCGAKDTPLALGAKHVSNPEQRSLTPI